MTNQYHTLHDNTPKNMSLDVIRGIAILLVVGFHSLSESPLTEAFDTTYCYFIMPLYTARINSLIPQIHNFRDIVDALISVSFGFGYQGVHLFIIISGTGLTLSFLKKGIELPRWYFRRAERILPMYWISLVLVQRLSQVWHLFFYFAPSNAAWVIVLQALCLHVLFRESASGINYPLWFVGLLFQLYLFFPFLVRFLSRTNALRFFLFSLLITVIFRLVGLYWLGKIYPDFAMGGSIFCRLGELAFGMCFALYIQGRGLEWIGLLRKLAAPLYICGILLHLSKPTNTISDTVIGISLFLILWNAIHHFPSQLQNGLSLLGRRSFGIFLFHSILIRPAYALSQSVTHDRYFLIFSVTLMCSILGAIIDLYFTKLQEVMTDRLRKRGLLGSLSAKNVK